MDVEEVRDLEEARRFVAEGLWLLRAVRPTVTTVKAALEWSMEVAASGHPMPPVGFIGDVGHIALGADAEHRAKEAAAIPGLPPALARQYEDHVLGKLYADPLFERAGDALQKLPDKDRARGLAFIVRRMQSRVKLPGVLLPPAVIRGLLRDPGEDVLSEAQERLHLHGPSRRTIAMYERMVAAARRSPAIIDADDVSKLNRGLAFGDALEVAWDHVVAAAKDFLEHIPHSPRRAHQRSLAVPTRLLDNDQYPVGGYSSISTKGSIESLLHSQLAYIEDSAEHPDLFDVRFARDELFYYSRDENQFLRRRRAFVVVLHSNLLAARYKDPELPYQRVILLLGAVSAMIQWFKACFGRHTGDELTLRFEVLFVGDEEKSPLADEMRLADLQLQDKLKPDEFSVERVKNAAAAAERIRALSGLMQLNVLEASAEWPKTTEGFDAVRLVLDGPVPRLIADGWEEELPGDTALDRWRELVSRLVELWM